MQRASLAQCLLLCGAMLGRVWAFDVDVPKEIPDEPFDIQAARLEYTNDTIIASGGVTGRFENVMVRADTVTGNPESGDLHMEGDILFERDNVVWKGSELDYNFITQKGDFGPSALDFDPVLMSVDHMERVSTNEYFMRGAVFTTCPRDEGHRHFHVRAKEAYLVDEEYLKAKGVTVYLGAVPVFYWPYWRQELDDSIFTFKLGFGSDWGAYALTTATVPILPNVNSVTDLNLYSARGVGVGQGLEWGYLNSLGRISAFHLYDQEPYERHSTALDKRQINEDRYRFRLEETHHFSGTHYLSTRWNYLSDPYILEEFFKQEYRSNPQPENFGSWVAGNAHVGSEAFVSKRLNNFYDNTDRVEYSADLYRTKLGNTPFYFASENSVAHLERVYAETNMVRTAYDSVRIDSANGLYFPQRFGFLSVVPRATYRATYYSKTAAVNWGGEEIRQIPGAGMAVLFQASKVLSNRERWYGTGLRHKIEPYTDYIYQDSSMHLRNVLQFDEIDALDDENKVKVGLRNVLQTKRDGRLARFIDLDLYTYHLIERNGGDDSFSPLYLDARMPLTARTLVDIEGEFDWNAGRIPFLNTRVSYRKNDDITFSFEHLYQQSQRSLWTPRVELYPGQDISFEAYARYDDNQNDVEEISFIIYKNYCCMRYGLGYHLYDDEHQLMFSIGLSAFPELNLGSGM